EWVRRPDLNKGFLGDGRMTPSEICCQWLEVRLLADCSGGNSRLSYLLGCGGRSFFDQEVGSQMRLDLGVWGEEPPLAFFFGFKSGPIFIFFFRWFVLCQ
ncbi:MAG TPA: hypothetical protein VM783_17530, partial [Candidatus Acidoferrum sp.]|nr:hypothetical protein [Candidatus Acidoferrum sp.]